MKEYNWKRVLDEIDTCVNLLAVWIILKDGEMCGRITARYSRSGSTTFVTFQMFGIVTVNGESIFGHERMSGWGYNRTTVGIGEILNENREKLKEQCSIELNKTDWELQNTWQKDIEAAGYTVIRAI